MPENGAGISRPDPQQDAVRAPSTMAHYWMVPNAHAPANADGDLEWTGPACARGSSWDAAVTHHLRRP